MSVPLLLVNGAIGKFLPVFSQLTNLPNPSQYFSLTLFQGPYPSPHPLRSHLSTLSLSLSIPLSDAAKSQANLKPSQTSHCLKGYFELQVTIKSQQLRDLGKWSIIA